MSYKEWKERYVEKSEKIKIEENKTQEKETGILKNDKIEEKKEEISKEFLELKDRCEFIKVKNNPVKLFVNKLGQLDIIKRLAGGDKTKGSCSSLAFAYIGNRAGFDVRDFRGGESCNIFSRMSSVLKIAHFKGVISYLEENTNDFLAVKKLLKVVRVDKEYYFATGQHAAIIRKTKKGIEYLELQSPETKGYTKNGFHLLTIKGLKKRFGCKKSHSIKGVGKVKARSLIIDVESLYNSSEFKDVLGYINTEESKQKKGGTGDVK